MNDEQINLIRRSFERISADAFADGFYHNLFSTQPALRLLFADDCGERRKRLTTLVAAAIDLLDDSERLVQLLEDAGRRLALDGVRNEHFEIFSAVLVVTVRERNEAVHSAETEAALTRFGALMSETMRQGARRLSAVPEQIQEQNSQENSMRIFQHRRYLTGLIFFIVLFAISSRAQTTAFTYQGKLNDGAVAANGSYLLEFKLFDTAGTQIGPTVSDVPATVTNGIFTVRLDFGANAFAGADRFLEIAVRRNTGESYTTLAPRQSVSSVPYAIKSKASETAVTATSAVNATNADTLDGIDSSGFVPTNTTSFVRNQTSEQTADFNINGSGTANILNAVSQFNLNGARILSVPGTDNLFLGVSAGNTTTNGTGNSLFGVNTGSNITFGDDNSFFGLSAGADNTSGNSNSFFGALAGRNNTGGNDNSFFGRNAGRDNDMGSSNTFVGLSAGLLNTVGSHNSVFGTNSGQNNTSGEWNAFFGRNTGLSNTTGIGNAVFGANAGRANITGNNNSILGYNADFGAANLTFATAIGSESRVSTSNTIALGRTNTLDTVLVFGRLQVNTLGSAGATSLCRNASNQISTCSSSLRYKTNISPFNSGLSIVSRLQPITFDWKDGGMKDLGLGAEDVAAVDENLIIRNAQGEVEGVKYDRLGVVLINAVKEQQTQIAAQQRLIDEQSRQIALLKQIVCSQNPNATVCKGEK